MLSSRRRFVQTASLTFAGALLASPMRVRALAANLAEDASAANVRRLDKGWQFHRGELSSIAEVSRPGREFEWQEVTLPHCVNGSDACDPEKPYFRGQGWYRTRTKIHNPFPEGRTLLHFQGAGQTTALWVGSALVGTHKGGYDEFAFDITEAVRAIPIDDTRDGISVAVCCDNSPDRERVPSDLSDFCLYGGLYRHVNLVYLPVLSLDAVHIQPTVQTDGSALVTVAARLYSPLQKPTSCEIAVEVNDAAGRSIYRASKTLAAWNDFSSLAAFHIAAPELWAPETPHLYRCRVTLSSAGGETSIEERFGVRQVEFVEHGPFKLNGKRVLLKGTQRHADHAGVAAAMSDELVRREIQLIRAMGANFIRLGHYQQDRLVLELCDELGLMVWEEAPWCRAGVGNESFRKNAKDMLAHMIDQHYNHPSVILWGLGNEDDWPDEYPAMDKEAIRGFMAEMRDLAHRLDGSRLTAFRRCDFARDIPDVYSPSIWAGWYRGNYREYELSLLAERLRVKRFVHIEWGADSHAGRHSEVPDAVLHKVAIGSGTDERGLDYLKSGGEVRVSKDGDWSETYACNLFDWHLKTQEKLDWLTGSAQWVFKDFASPLRGDNAIPRVNQKGLVERDLTPKESYYVFQSYWAQTPMAHIYGHSWPVRWGKPGETRCVRVYSNCDSAEMFLNGASLGVKHRESQDFPSAGLRWETAFEKGINHLRVIAKRGPTTVSDELSFIYQTDSWGKPNELRLVEKERKGSTTTVAVLLIDQRGVLCLDAANLIRFSLTGEGRLIDNQGTARASREVQLANGRAEISLEGTGRCSITASADGLPAATLIL